LTVAYGAFISFVIVVTSPVEIVFFGKASQIAMLVPLIDNPNEPIGYTVSPNQIKLFESLYIFILIIFYFIITFIIVH